MDLAHRSNTHTGRIGSFAYNSYGVLTAVPFPHINQVCARYCQGERASYTYYATQYGREVCTAWIRAISLGYSSCGYLRDVFCLMSAFFIGSLCLLLAKYVFFLLCILAL